MVIYLILSIKSNGYSPIVVADFGVGCTSLPAISMGYCDSALHLAIEPSSSSATERSRRRRNAATTSDFLNKIGVIEPTNRLVLLTLSGHTNLAV
jgi:hypothetical protein